MSIRSHAFSLCLLLVSCCAGLQAQHSANSNAVYQQLRGLMPGNDVITVNKLVLRRDAAIFTFRQGSIAFFAPVNGKVTGAVFRGDGHFRLTPPTEEERHNLSIVSHKDEFDEDFDVLVLRFTDTTAAELQKGSVGKGMPDSAFGKGAQEFHNLAKTKLRDNYDLRILEDVLSPAEGGYFLAAIHGRKNSRLVFILDPHGVAGMAPEEVALLNWSEWGLTYPAAFHTAIGLNRTGGDAQERNAAYRINSEDLDVSIERNGFLSGLSTVHATADVDGVAVIPFNLHPTLRVSRAETEKGEPLDFVQEKKEEDADFGVVLASPLKKGDSVTLRLTYSGKDVVIDEGNANYYPVARENWYPNSASGMGDYATYHMLFHISKGLQLVATGTKISEKTDGKITTTEWKTDVPLAMVGL